MNLTDIFDKMKNMHMVYLLAIVSLLIPTLGSLFIFLGSNLLNYNFLTLILISTCGGVALGLPAYVSTLVLTATSKETNDPNLNELVFSYVMNCVIVCFILMIFEIIYYLFYSYYGLQIFLYWLLGLAWIVIPILYVVSEIVYRKHSKNKAKKLIN